MVGRGVGAALVEAVGTSKLWVLRKASTGSTIMAATVMGEG